jgi:hypothetical protein
MRRGIILGVLGLAAMSLAGCSSYKYPVVSGNWLFTGKSTVTPTTSTVIFGGAVSSKGSSLNATLHTSNPCFNNQAIAFTGSISTQNLIKLGSATYNNQVITLNGTVSSTGSILTAGTYTVTAQKSGQPICTNSNNGDNGSLTGSEISEVTGTYSGTLTSSVNGADITTTAQLVGTSTADSNGLYHVTGTFTFAGDACFTSATITSSEIYGNQFSIVTTGSDGSTITLTGTTSASAQLLTVTNYAVSGGACNGDMGKGVLQQQA